MDLANLEKLTIPVGADFYVCGPPAFLRDMNRDLIVSWHTARFDTSGSVRTRGQY